MTRPPEKNSEHPLTPEPLPAGQEPAVELNKVYQTVFQGATPWVLLAGLALTAATFWQMRQNSVDLLETDFNNLAVERAQFIQNHLHHAQDDTDAVRRFKSHSTKVTREEFRTFTQPSNSERSEKTIEWVPRVPQERRAAMEAAARAEGWQDFQFTERNAAGQLVRAADRAEYFPAYFVEPLEGNEAALGFDLGSEPLRRTALEKARDSGRFSVSAPIRLVQGTEKKTRTLLLFPVYETGQPVATIDERRAHLRGFALAILSIDALVKAATKPFQPTGLDVQLQDLDAPAEDRVLYSHASRLGEGAAVVEESPSGLTLNHDFEFGGRRWRVMVEPNTAFIQNHTQSAHWVVLPLGLLLTGLLASHMSMLSTHRQRAEAMVRLRTDELRTSEERLRAIFDTEPECVKLLAADGALLDMNPAGLRMIEADSLAEVQNQNIYPFVVEKHRAAFIDLVDRTMRGESDTLQFQIIGLKGTQRWMEMHATPMRDDAGRVTAQLSVTRDITERKEAEATLAEHNRILELIVSGAPLQEVLDTLLRFVGTQMPEMMSSILLLDSDGQHLRHGAAPRLPEAYNTFIDGIAIGPVAGSCGTAAFRREPVFVEDIATDPLWADYRDIAQSHDLHACWSTPMFGTRNQLLGTFAIYYSKPGMPTEAHLRIIQIATDMATIAIARPQDEAALRESEERKTSILAGALDAIITIDARGIIMDWNRSAEELFGYLKEDALDRRMAELIIPPLQRDAHQQGMERFLTSGEGPILRQLLELTAMRADGTEFLVELFITPIQSEPPLFTGFIRDITKRKQAEEKLRASLKAVGELRAALDEHAIVEVTNAEGISTFVNDKLCQISQYSSEELLGKDHSPINSGYHSQAFFRDLWKTIADGWVWQGEIKNRTKDGSFFWVDTTIVPFLDDRGKPREYIAISADITIRKQAEEDILTLNAELEHRVVKRTEQLEAANKELEAFSYSISHDLRTPLRAINGFAEIVIEDFGAQLPDEAIQYLKNICDGSIRMGKLINDLLAFSRLNRKALTFEPVDTARLVQGVLDDLQPQREGRTIELRIGQLPQCYCDPSLLNQVWVNLLSNAIKYSRGREPAVIEIGCEHTEDGDAFFIRDNGTGFDMQYASKLFEVFQRLHRDNEFEGTGVGLAIVQRIIHRHGGRVWAESAPGLGATFRFTLNEENPA